MRFKHIILLTKITPSCPSTVGTQGHGEGLDYGTNPFNRGVSSTYYYRFSGKNIPREGIVYLTCEENHFSRAVGDKSQIIVVYDKQEEGFRLIEHIPASVGGVKDRMKFYHHFESSNDALLYVEAEKEKEDIYSKKIKEALDRGDDLF
jgi:hypothetical protein